MADPVVTLNGYQLHPPALDGTGSSLEDEGDTPGLDGWYGTPKPRSSYTPRPADPGSYASPMNFDSERVITCNGALIEASSTAFLLAQRILVALCPDAGVLYPFVVTDDAGTLTAQVQRSDAILTKPLSNLAGKYSIVLTAPDPYRYDPNLVSNVNIASTTLAISPTGLDWSTGGGLDWTGGSTGGLVWGAGGSDGTCTVLNLGTAPSWPKFTVAGPTDAATLTNLSLTDSATGQVLAYSGLMQQNDVLVIDSNPATRSALLNGIDVWSSLSTAQWFTVPAGGQLRTQFQGTTTSTTPLLTVSAANAYK